MGHLKTELRRGADEFDLDGVVVESLEAFDGAIVIHFVLFSFFGIGVEVVEAEDFVLENRRVVGAGDVEIGDAFPGMDHVGGFHFRADAVGECEIFGVVEVNAFFEVDGVGLSVFGNFGHVGGELGIELVGFDGIFVAVEAFIDVGDDGAADGVVADGRVEGFEIGEIDVVEGLRIAGLMEFEGDAEGDGEEGDDGDVDEEDPFYFSHLIASSPAQFGVQGVTERFTY